MKGEGEGEKEGEGEGEGQGEREGEGGFTDVSGVEFMLEGREGKKEEVGGSVILSFEFDRLPEDGLSVSFFFFFFFFNFF